MKEELNLAKFGMVAIGTTLMLAIVLPWYICSPLAVLSVSFDAFVLRPKEYVHLPHTPMK